MFAIAELPATASVAGSSAPGVSDERRDRARLPRERDGAPGTQ
jgi:hypothetical protein